MSIKSNLNSPNPISTSNPAIQVRRKKGYHTWIEGANGHNYTELDFEADVLYAYYHRGNAVPQPNEVDDIYGFTSSVDKYYSKFPDGTKVTLIVKDPFLYPEIGRVLNNHLAAIIIDL